MMDQKHLEKVDTKSIFMYIYIYIFILAGGDCLATAQYAQDGCFQTLQEEPAIPLTCADLAVELDGSGSNPTDLVTVLTGEVRPMALSLSLSLTE